MIITDHAYNFRCRMCGSCCRSGWRINVEKNIAEKLLDLADYDIYIKENLRLIQSDGLTPHFDRKGCGLISADNLCYLHSNYGVDYLGSTCLSYPKKFIRTNEGLFCGLSYSCPAAADTLNTYVSGVKNLQENEFDNIPQIISFVETDENLTRLENRIIQIILNKNGNNLNLLLEIGENFDYKPESVIIMESGNFKKIKKLLKTVIEESFVGVNKVNQFSNDTQLYISCCEVSFRNYTLNYYLLKSFYEYRGMPTDTYVILLFIYHLASFVIESEEDIAGFYSEIDRLLFHTPQVSKKLIATLTDYY